MVIDMLLFKIVALPLAGAALLFGALAVGIAILHHCAPKR